MVVVVEAGLECVLGHSEVDFILHKQASKFDNNCIGLHRDDGLAVDDCHQA